MGQKTGLTAPKPEVPHLLAFPGCLLAACLSPFQDRLLSYVRGILPLVFGTSAELAHAGPNQHLQQESKSALWPDAQ